MLASEIPDMRNCEMKMRNAKMIEASLAKLFFRSFGDRDMECQVISSQGMSKCRNVELRNGEISTRSII
jgi:hypothetical protein